MNETVREFKQDGFDIIIRHTEDESPDLSYLGEFYQKRGTPAYPYFDRATRTIVRSYDGMPDDEDASWSNREWRYIHGFQCPEDDAAILADVKRLETYGDDWACIGVIAVACRAGVELGRGSLWGVESDGGKEYFADIERDITAEAIHEAKAKLAELKAS